MAGELGPDTSSYQGNPDWAAVAGSGRRFAFTKASEGVSYRDPTFARNWAGIRASGMARGAYHFGRPSYNNGAINEADWFSNVVLGNGLGSGDRLWLDSEDPAASGWDLRQWCQDFQNRTQQRTGVRPGMYSFRSYLVTSLRGDPRFARDELWEAAYQGSAPSPAPPWNSLAFWQHTDAARIPGIGGGVDESIAYAALAGGVDMTTGSEKNAFVRLAYVAGLGREPESFASLGFWASAINDDGNNVESIVVQILDSAEGTAYRQKLAAGTPGPEGPPGPGTLTEHAHKGTNTGGVAT